MVYNLLLLQGICVSGLSQQHCIVPALFAGSPRLVSNNPFLSCSPNLFGTKHLSLWLSVNITRCRVLKLFHGLGEGLT